MFIFRQSLSYGLHLFGLTVVALMCAACVGVGTLGGLEGEADGHPPTRIDSGPDPDDGGPPPEDTEPPPEDTGPPPEDTEPPPEDTGPPPCEYPDGPYAINIDRVVPPMRWSSAVAMTGESDEPDFDDFYCDPAVRGIFIYFGTST